MSYLSLTLKHGVLVPCGCRNKWPQTGLLKTTEIFSLTAVEGRSPKSRCWRGRSPSQGSRGEPFLASVLASNPRSASACSCATQSLSRSSRGLLCVSVILCCQWLLIRRPVTRLGSTLIQYDLILTNDNCKEPISKWGHVLRFWMDGTFRGTLFDSVQPSGFSADW